MKREKYRQGQRDALNFRSLPDRAQEIWFQYCDNAIITDKYYDLAFSSLVGFDYRDCKSPIEVIFNFAYDLVAFSEGYFGYSLKPQYEVQINIPFKKVSYRVDFVFLAEEINEMVDIKNPDFKLAIECDGHEFHEKTKEQVANDNEREYDLKFLNFDVLRFSGSQIYNNPFRCAKQTLEYIKAKIGEEKKSE